MHGELRAALDAAAGDREVRCVVITGTGRGFCAGQDLADPAVAEPEPAASRRRRRRDRALLQAARLAHPLDAGAGRSPRSTASPPAPARTSRCSATSSSPRARRASSRPSSKIGLVPDCGGTWLLPRLVGRANALAWRMLGDKLGAEDAVRLGLIWKCVDDAALRRRGRRAERAPGGLADARAGRDPPGARRLAAARPRRRAQPRGRRAAHARRRARLPRRRRRLHGQARRRVQRSLRRSDACTPSLRRAAAARRPRRSAPTCSPPTAPRAASACASSRSVPAAARLEMTVRDDMLNGHDICHGGFITTLADSAFAFACNSRNQLTVAAGLTVDFLAPGASRRRAHRRRRRGLAGRPDRRLRHRRHQPARRARRARARPLAHACSDRTVMPGDAAGARSMP